MPHLLSLMLGEGVDLNMAQMALRAVIAFALTLALIRVAGRRAFGQKTPFDACTTVLLGAVLSRAVVGASPFWSTASAGLALALMHRAMAMASHRWPWFDRWVNGSHRQFAEAGIIDPAAMRKALLNAGDLEEAVRKKTGGEDLAVVARAVLERDGSITIVASR